MASEPASGEEPESPGAEAGPPADAEAAAEPKPDKPSRRGNKSEVAAETPAALPGAGTPEGDQLADAHQAFEIGDYRRVRQLCRVLEQARQDDVSSAARELDARTRVDLVQVVVLCACLAFFAWIAYVYVIK